MFSFIVCGKMLFSFSLDSDFILAKMHHANYYASISKRSLIFFSYDFTFKLSAITRLCFSRVALRELDRERS